MNHDSDYEDEGAPELDLEMLREDLIGELQAINQYQEHIDTMDDEEAIEVLEHIRDEEKEHVLYRYFEFHLAEGEDVYITGYSGSCKSVLLRALEEDLPAESIVYFSFAGMQRQVATLQNGAAGEDGYWEIDAPGVEVT